MLIYRSSKPKSVILVISETVLLLSISLIGSTFKELPILFKYWFYVRNIRNEKSPLQKYWIYIRNICN